MLTYLLIAAAVQIVFAMIVGGFADMRGRDGAVWFLIGLVIGPVAFIPLAFYVKPA